MSTTTRPDASGRPAPAGHRRRRARAGTPPARRAQPRRLRSPPHGVLIVASLIALFPIAWLVFLSLGPDKDDYLHPGRICDKMTLRQLLLRAPAHRLPRAGSTDSLIVVARHHGHRRAASPPPPATPSPACASPATGS